MAEQKLDAADLLALSGTVDSLSGVLHLTKGGGYDWYNDFAAAIHRIGLCVAPLGCRVYKDADLTCGVRAGKYWWAGVLTTYAGATGQALSDDSTNRIYINAASGALVITTDAWSTLASTAHIRLAEIVTADGVYDITDITDLRGAGLLTPVNNYDLKPERLSLMLCRNADGTVLDATGSATAFLINAGNWGTGTLTLLGADAVGASITSTLCFEYVLPDNYIADADVKLMIRAKYDDGEGGSSPTCTINAEAYELDDAGAVGSDLVVTAVQNLTNAFADYTFVLTDTGLAAGDRLMVLVRTAVTEGGGSFALFSAIGSIEMQSDRQG